jgi:sugar fermentation stimulation protein A
LVRSPSFSHQSISLFPPPEEAFFISRPNRFLVVCRRAKETVTAHLPNPGRLQELLLPGQKLLLVRSPGKHRKYPDTVVGAESRGQIIMLDTLRTNAAARALIERHKVRGLERATIVKAEVPHGQSRFDFLLDDSGEALYLEVKSCTLVGEEVAMFPDAVTARGTKHLIELARLGKTGKKVAVLFMVHTSRVKYFMPDYHTDLRFAQTFLACRHEIRYLPVGVQWGKDLSLYADTRPLTIPWSYLEREIADRGSYLIFLRLPKDEKIIVGMHGAVWFRKGYYVYVGSAMANLSSRVDRHQRGPEHRHWHIDYLRKAAHFQKALPVRASARLECSLADSLSPLAHWSIRDFGCSDCHCQTHLFGFEDDPLQMPAIQDLIVYFRMDRCVESEFFTQPGT